MKFWPATATLDDKIQIAILWFIKISIVVAIVWSGLVGNGESFLASVIALALTFVPDFIKRRYGVNFPVEFDFIIIIFIYMSIILGEVADAYYRFWWWDSLLHTSSGVLFGFVGFLILHIFTAREKIKAHPRVFAFFTFCVAVAAGAVWEIFEYLADETLGTNLQKSGLQDTMWDLIVDGIGGGVIALAAYFHVKNGSRSGLVARFVNSFLKLNPRLQRKGQL